MKNIPVLFQNKESEEIMATKRQIQAQQTRQKIVDTAQKLIAERGYENVTIRDIASECGIALGTMYHYFSKKEDLIIFNDRERFLDLFVIAKEKEELSPLEQLRFFISEWFKNVASDNVNYSRHWHRMAVSLEATESEDGKNRLEQDIRYIAYFLNRAIEEGELRRETPVQDIAIDLACSMYGASLGRCISHEDVNILIWADRFLNNILSLHFNPYRV